MSQRTRIPSTWTAEADTWAKEAVVALQMGHVGKYLEQLVRDDRARVLRAQGRPPREPPSAASADARPTIRIVAGELDRAIEESIGALRSDPDVYQDEGRLLDMLPGETARALPAATLRQRLTRAAVFLQFDRRSKTWAHVVPNDHVVRGVLARGVYPGIRVLARELATPSSPPSSDRRGRSEDRDAMHLATILRGLRRLDPEARGRTSAALVAWLWAPARQPEDDDLRATLRELTRAREGREPSTVSVGAQLRRFLGREADGLVLRQSITRMGLSEWLVAPTGAT